MADSNWKCSLITFWILKSFPIISYQWSHDFASVYSKPSWYWISHTWSRPSTGSCRLLFGNIIRRPWDWWRGWMDVSSLSEFRWPLLRSLGVVWHHCFHSSIRWCLWMVLFVCLLCLVSSGSIICGFCKYTAWRPRNQGWKTFSGMASFGILWSVPPFFGGRLLICNW